MKDTRRDGHGKPPNSIGGDASTTSPTSLTTAANHTASAKKGLVAAVSGKVGTGANNASSTAVWAGRILFTLTLVTVAALLGWVGHVILSKSERRLAETQYESIAERALHSSTVVVRQRRWSAATMAAVAAEMNPDAAQWPFAAVPGFESIVQRLLNASSGLDMGFVPLVPASQQSQWETFAYDYFVNVKNFPPKTTGVSSFGRGIWARNLKLNTTDQRYHDTGLNLDHNEILTPVFHTDEGANPFLMFNVYSIPNRQEVINDMLECSQQRHDASQLAALTKATTVTNAAAGMNNNWQDEIQCGRMTPFLKIVKVGGKPGAAMFQPIYPANNPTTMVGFLPTVILFDEILANIFANSVSGIHCVLSTDGDESITYEVVDGIALLVDRGDHHQAKYDAFRRSATLTDAAVFTRNSPVYTLSLYPNDDLFMKVYSTENPTIAMVGAVGIMLFTSLAFFLYDFFVRREFHAKRELLHAKRQFMRFVSHEVRTPLNSVCMGLSVMQGDMAGALGYSTAQRVLIDHDDETGNPVLANGKPFDRETLDWFLLAREVETNAQSAVSVLNDLLNYDKIERGSLHLECSIVKIWKLVQTTAEEFKLPAANKKLKYAISFRAPESNAAASSQRRGERRRPPPRLSRQPQEVEKDLEAGRKEHQCASETTATGTGPDDELGGMIEVGVAEALPSNVCYDYHLLGDAVRIAQVIRNLISNAIKFTPEGGLVKIQAALVLPSEQQDEQDQQKRQEQPPSQRGGGLDGTPDAGTQRKGKINKNRVKINKRKVKKKKSKTGCGGKSSCAEEDSAEIISLQGGKQIAAKRSKGHIQVCVQDSGAGLSEEQLSKLFRDGVQFNVNVLQAGQGSGLGLYITKGLVEQHNGTLEASSPGLGRGTTFTMTLPLWHVLDQDGNPAGGLGGGSSSPFGFDYDGGSAIFDVQMTTLRVLIVDDAQTNRKLLCRLLTKAGHACDQAENGAIAVDMVKASMATNDPDMQYDSVIMDYEMPVMSGPDATKEIRRAGSDVYVVGVTGNVLPEDVSHFKACGANAVLPKPMKVVDLESLWVEYGVRTAVKASRGSRQQQQEEPEPTTTITSTTTQSVPA